MFFVVSLLEHGLSRSVALQTKNVFVSRVRFVVSAQAQPARLSGYLYLASSTQPPSHSPTILLTSKPPNKAIHSICLLFLVFPMPSITNTSIQYEQHKTALRSCTNTLLPPSHLFIGMDWMSNTDRDCVFFKHLWCPFYGYVVQNCASAQSGWPPFPSISLIYMHAFRTLWSTACMDVRCIFGADYFAPYAIWGHWPNSECTQTLETFNSKSHQHKLRNWWSWAEWWSFSANRLSLFIGSWFWIYLVNGFFTESCRLLSRKCPKCATQNPK